MTSFAVAFKDQVKLLSRKEIRTETRIFRRAAAQARREIAVLKRLVASLQKQLHKSLEGAAVVTPRARAGLPEGTRFSARSVRAQRKRLGISAANFGKLIGVSGLTVYHWESGKARPRAKQLAAFVSIRGIGRREALAKLSGSAK